MSNCGAEHPNRVYRGKRMAGELTPLQLAFVDAYMECQSARKAAEIAGYADPSSYGWRIIHVKAVADEISRRKEEMRRRNEHVEDQVVRELALVGFANIADFINFSNNSITIKCLDDIPEGVRPCIKKVTLTPGQHGDRIQIELHDKLKALEMLGKYMDLWGDSKVQTPAGAPGAAPIQVVTGIPRPPDGPAADDWSDL